MWIKQVGLGLVIAGGSLVAVFATGMPQSAVGRGAVVALSRTSVPTRRSRQPIAWRPDSGPPFRSARSASRFGRHARRAALGRGDRPLPARCEVDGRSRRSTRRATARPINFRVCAAGRVERRAVQQGGGGMNGVHPGSDAARGTASTAARRRSWASSPTAATRAISQAARGARPGRSRRRDWALNDEAMKNLGYMQMKKTHDAAMVLIERAYGERPRYNYFIGTSQGGREALTVAQRYPADYDGVDRERADRQLLVADARAGADPHSGEAARPTG